MGYLEEGRVARGLEGEYHVERRLAKSRHHTLYIARDARGRAVLMKELHASDLREWADIERLQAEARLLADIRHARVPPFVELFATDGATAESAGRFTERFVRLPDGAFGDAIREDGALPSLVMVRAFVAGETIEEAAARGRPFTASQLENCLCDLLGLAANLHAMVPAVVHGEIDATRVVLDEGGRAHLIGFGSAATRRKRAPHAAGDAPTPEDDVRAIGRVVEHLIGDERGDASAISPRVLAVIRTLRASRAPVSARAALAMLAEPPRPSALRRIGRSKGVRFATLALVSLTGHGMILGAIVRAASKQPAAVATPPPIGAVAPGRPMPLPTAQVVPLSPAPPPPPQPPPLFWTGQVLESSDPLVSTGGPVAIGAPCVMTADVSGSEGAPDCSISLTCGGALVLQNSLATTCEVIEQALPNGAFQARLKASSVGPANGLSYRIEPGAAFIVNDSKRLRVKLALTSNAQSGGRRLTHETIPFAAETRIPGVAVKVEGDTRVRSGDACTLRLAPLADEVEKPCSIEVVCGGAKLYSKAHTCRSDGLRVVDYRDVSESVIDGDPSFLWEDHLLVLEDLTPVRREHVEIYLLEEKPHLDSE